MHESAMKYGKAFFETYCASNFSGKVVVDVGAQDVNGSLREFCPEGANYIGVDFVEGRGVDVLITDPYQLPFESETVDVVVCSSVFEHSEFFWLLFLECVRIIKPSGLIYLNMPSNGMMHRFPIDGWRFYPDAGRSLVNWSRYNSYDTLLLESFLGERQGSIAGEGMWNDFVAVILKDQSYESHYPARIQNAPGNFFYGYSSGRDNDLSQFAQMPDHKLIMEQQGDIDSLKQSVFDRDSRITSLSQSVFDRDSQITSLNQSVFDRDSQIARLEQEIQALRSSTSWRVTKPLRCYKSVFFDKPCILVRAIISISVNKIWSLLPINSTHKASIKSFTFKKFPAIFKHTKTYQAWKFATDNPKVYISWLDEPLEFVSRSESVIDFTPPVKVIAFFLPQYHEIPENNLWWGEGFTEWSNVQPATQQYQEQYQPHEPVDIGYYDLSTTEVQHKQIELAKEYGIGGFCFYFYWFDRKTLLEKPIENYLADKSLEFPFCLCWANENWSRRWDGLDSELLISQNHSPEDDTNFIEYISKYLIDDRYIRVDGKPLLIVYRPSLLPDARETAERWRSWCRENGVGEIFIALTHSFDSTNPSDIGFDAAIEFPPNKWDMSQHDYTNIVQRVNKKFSGNVYDWTVFLDREPPIGDAQYTLFRSVNPSWDNTARRKDKSISFVKSSPRGYQEWLHNAALDTIGRFPTENSRLVFVNAWNEWAEGAHLEPDSQYGYGYLEATRLALLRAPL